MMLFYKFHNLDAMKYMQIVFHYEKNPLYDQYGGNVPSIRCIGTIATLFSSTCLIESEFDAVVMILSDL